MGRTLTVCALFVGILVRLFLFQTAFESLSKRNELVTPVTSFSRGDPYEGDTVHAPPLLLFGFDWLLTNTSLEVIKGFYVDLLAAVLLYYITKRYQQIIFPEDMAESIDQFSPAVIDNLPSISLCFYLLNPMTVCTCVAMSTTVFVNLSILLMLYSALWGKRTLSAFFCAIGAYLDLYPSLLAILIGLVASRARNSGRPKGDSDSRATSAASAWELTFPFFVFATFFAILLFFSHELLGSWKFLHKCYGFIIFVLDLQPNIGLFWYFFAEVFSEFRNLFIFCFQFHLVLYPIPLAYRLGKHPVFVMWIMLAIISAFKSYPSFGDIGLYLSLIPLFYHKLHEFEYGFLSAATFIVLGVLYPIMWHMWIIAGTGNANFYYALTLATAVCNGYIISDSISALYKRKYLIKHHRD